MNIRIFVKQLQNIGYYHKFYLNWTNYKAFEIAVKSNLTTHAPISFSRIEREFSIVMSLPNYKTAIIYQETKKYI